MAVPIAWLARHYPRMGLENGAHPSTSPAAASPSAPAPGPLQLTVVLRILGADQAGGSGGGAKPAGRSGKGV